MIYGAHIILFSKDANADRVFMRDVLGFPDEENGRHELFFMTDDLDSEMASLAERGVECSQVEVASWGRVTRIRLPGGGDVALYQSNLPSAFDRASN
ncbi:MAG: extradiol dioxygenase [Acidimicrobiales bacterium]